MDNDDQGERKLNFITTAEAAARLDRHPSTIVRWCELGKIEYVDKVPGTTGTYLFDPVYINRLVIDQATAAHQAAS